jgi:hypothetical protein
MDVASLGMKSDLPLVMLREEFLELYRWVESERLMLCTTDSKPANLGPE